MSNQTHVATHPKGWAAKDTGNEKASRVFDKKQDAVDWARQHSRRVESELVIHRKDGTIGQKDSHGHDPYPPKG
jgi:hypothetical protein